MESAAQQQQQPNFDKLMMVYLGATAAAAVTNYTQRNVRSLYKNCLYTIESQQNNKCH